MLGFIGLITKILFHAAKFLTIGACSVLTTLLSVLWKLLVYIVAFAWQAVQFLWTQSTYDTMAFTLLWESLKDRAVIAYWQCMLLLRYPDLIVTFLTEGVWEPFILILASLIIAVYFVIPLCEFLVHATGEFFIGDTPEVSLTVWERLTSFLWMFIGDTPEVSLTVWERLTSFLWMLLRFLQFIANSACFVFFIVISSMWNIITITFSTLIQVSQFVFNIAIAVTPTMLSSVCGALIELFWLLFHSLFFLICGAVVSIYAAITVTWNFFTSVLTNLLELLKIDVHGTITVLQPILLSVWQEFTDKFFLLLHSLPFPVTGSSISMYTAILGMWNIITSAFASFVQASKFVVILIYVVILGIWNILTSVFYTFVQASMFVVNGAKAVTPVMLSSIWEACTMTFLLLLHSLLFLISGALSLTLTVFTTAWKLLTSIFAILMEPLESLHLTLTDASNVISMAVCALRELLASLLVTVKNCVCFFSSGETLSAATDVRKPSMVQTALSIDGISLPIFIIAALFALIVVVAVVYIIFQKVIAPNSLSGNPDLLPKNWKPMPLKRSGCEVTVHLVDLEKNTTEYKEVASLIKTTSKKCNIFSIQRIQNPHLFQLYTVLKRKLDKENVGIDIEMRLFHGTSAENVQKINEHGFNRSFCGVNGTNFGQGVYFARRASYSISYARASINGLRYMYLARVLVGRHTEGHHWMKEPPMDHRTNRKYDSVRDKYGEIFVVFHDAQCYPEYLITFS